MESTIHLSNEISSENKTLGCCMSLCHGNRSLRNSTRRKFSHLIHLVVEFHIINLTLRLRQMGEIKISDTKLYFQNIKKMTELNWLFLLLIFVQPNGFTSNSNFYIPNFFFFYLPTLHMQHNWKWKRKFNHPKKT